MFDDAMAFTFTRRDGSRGRVFMTPHTMVTELNGHDWLTTATKSGGEVKHELNES